MEQLPETVEQAQSQRLFLSSLAKVLKENFVG
jgi:hypothetical protein